ncbi:MAG TPA: DUF2996 domain-containing protein [Leptolyngbyaceae cyanobacterium M65_K2018_010]|nr:DUF2996 domain-containing protein [Leptolyngbyaceae cyanobacterium M65_K2018_010]
MADEKTPETAPATESAAATPDSLAAQSAAAPKAAPKTPAKKEKPPAVEDKPFTDFIRQDFLPSLETALKDKGIRDIQLSFDQAPLAVFGVTDGSPYWQVKGQWGGDRQFNIAFTKDSIASPKLFYCSDRGSQPSTLEQFMGDERKITLDLMVLYTLQRLNGQKWLVRN